MLPTPQCGEPHDCKQLTDDISKCRPDLLDTAIPDSNILFVDGSASKSETGQNLVGYAVVTQTKVLEAKALPSNFSAQAAELVALTRACELMKGKSVTIYTDSQYAHSAVHVFAQHWKNRGTVTTTGKAVTHKELLLNLLDAIQLPKNLAICKCAAHTKGTDAVSKGNAYADFSAKLAAKNRALHQAQTHTSLQSNDTLQISQQQSPQTEKDLWIKHGAVLRDGIYT